MNAEQMFKELGYTYYEYRDGFAFEKECVNRVDHIHFFPEYHIYVTNVYRMNVELHKAITKQMEELGWLDD